jgi:hypothetical protein
MLAGLNARPILRHPAACGNARARSSIATRRSSAPDRPERPKVVIAGAWPESLCGGLDTSCSGVSACLGRKPLKGSSPIAAKRWKASWRNALSTSNASADYRRGTSTDRLSHPDHAPVSSFCVSGFGRLLRILLPPRHPVIGGGTEAHLAPRCRGISWGSPCQTKCRAAADNKQAQVARSQLVPELRSAPTK